MADIVLNARTIAKSQIVLPFPKQMFLSFTRNMENKNWKWHFIIEFSL